MTRELLFQAIIKFVAGVIIIGLLIFLPAGTLAYPGAWLFLCILFIPMFCAGIVMMLKNPQLLWKRLSAKEKQSEQKLVIKLSGLMFVLGFVVAGLNYRFGWTTLRISYPGWQLLFS